MDNGLVPVLAEIFGNTLGLDPQALDPRASFLELGADSLSLLQAAQKIESRVGVSVPFRTLLEEHPSIAALAAHLAERGATVKGGNGNGTGAILVAPSVPAAVAVPEVLQRQMAAVELAAERQPAPGSAVERIIRQQLQVMSRQLEALGRARRARPVAVEAVAAPAPPPARGPAPELPGRAEVETFVPYKPLDVGAGQGLTSQQQEHLDRLVSRYTRRTAGSKRLAQEEHPWFADSMSSAGFSRLLKEMVYQIVTERSASSRVWDVDGNEYLDMNMGFGVHFFGHAPAFIQEALREQIERGYELGPQSVLTGEVSRLVCELTGMDRVAFCTSGTEAVMSALRIARAVTRRSMVVSFAGSYHGGFDGVLARPGEGYGALSSLPLAPGVLPSMVQDMRVLPYDRPETLEYLEQQAGNLAAILVEPVQSRRPDIQPAAFLRELRRITEAAGTLLIFDEVITGFRLHPRGAQGWYGIRADLATYGKVAGGGLPIGLVAGKARFMDAVDGGSWSYGDASYPRVEQTFLAHTFAKHPLSLAAARAALGELRSRGPALQEGLNRRGAGLAGRLNAWFEAEDVPLRVASCGSMLRFLSPTGLKLVDLFFYHLLTRGVFLLRGRPFFLSTAHTDRDLDLFCDAVVDSVSELRRGGFLERGSVPAPVLWTSPEKPAEAPAKEVPEIPLTEGQQQLWLIAQLSPEASKAYNQVVALRVRGPFDLAAFQGAVAQLVDRHEALRTTISPQGDRQRIASRLDVSIPVAEVSPVDLDRWMAVSTDEPFDLASGPLFKICVAKLGTDDTVLLFNFHHIVTDGWSIGILLSEIAALFGGAALPEPVQYRTYVEWLSRKLSGPDFERAEAYWIGEFRDGAPPSDLPADHPRPLVQTFAGNREILIVDRPRLDPVLRVAARLGCTPFMATLAAFRIFLHAITRRDDFVLGIPVAGQALVHERLVGYCINMLPLRTRIADGMTLEEGLLEVKRKMAAASEHQLYPFPRLVRKINPPRDASRSPIVNATFNLDRSPAADFGGLDVTFLPYRPGVANMDLEINLIESAAGLRVQWDFNTDLFDLSTIQRWMAAFVEVLATIGADPKRRMEDRSVLSEAERHALVCEFNDTAGEPLEPCVHQLFEAQARETPNAVAVSFEGVRLTYCELDRRANQLARFLRRMGVGPEVLVGLGVERSPELLVGLLGILKAGGAYLPLDASYPGQRLAWMLEDARVSVVVTQAALAGAFPLQGARVVLLDRDLPRIEAESADPLPSATRPENLAYVIFTSGSTGRPKGVQIPHRGVVNFLASMRDAPGLAVDDALLSVTTLSFDIAVLELLLPLTVGARVELVSRETVSDGRLLAGALARSGATVLQATPATWQVLLDSGWRGGGRLKVLCGGEALTRELANRLLEEASSVWNMYGPTETTIWSATSRVEAGEGEVTIGPPLRNTEIHVLDGRLAPVPLGVPGELCIGGAGLARGYLRRPDLTAERFMPDPLGPPGARLYRTGDLVRRLARGGIEFMGRLDDQVKIRGFRIELGEIRSVLEAHPGIRGTAVIVKRYSAGDHRIVAFFVPAEEGSVTPAALRRFARERLPEHMVPSAFVAVDGLPLLPNGKVDRHALSRLIDSGPGLRKEGETVLPQTGTESAVARIWRQALQVDAISIHDDFFELGGHSLLVPQIFIELREAGWPGVSMVDVFRYPTVSSFAAHLDALAASSPFPPVEQPARSSVLVELKPGDPAKAPLFLVHAVGGTVFFYQDLIDHLRTCHPVYGLQSRGLDGREAPLTRIEDMAAVYLQEIARVAPAGPYLLAGASMGGAVAFEMVRQLARRGEEVALLALFDTPGHGDLPTPCDEDELLARVVQDVASQAPELAIQTRSLGAVEHLLPLWKANYRALLAYDPPPSPGRLAYFRARERDSSDPSRPEQRWVALSEGGADVQIVPGNHASMLRAPAVEGLARRLQRCIEEGLLRTESRLVAAP
jgi:amino acid adenylation domain-containing protein